MNLKKIIKLFEKGNVCVTGLRGTGKDMLFSNVAVRRKKKYISNVPYGGDCVPFDYSQTLNLGDNTFKEFISGNVKQYVFPYSRGTDIYISDAGVYFPSQECSYLDKTFKGAPLFMALSRHLGANVFVNVQNLERCWKKIVEQSEVYIRCEKCVVLFGKIVLQTVCVYERADSCQMRVPPCPYKVPLFAPRESKALYKLKQLDYQVAHGEIKRYLLIYINKSKYNTYSFEEVLKNA